MDIELIWPQVIQAIIAVIAKAQVVSLPIESCSGLRWSAHLFNFLSFYQSRKLLDCKITLLKSCDRSNPRMLLSIVPLFRYVKQWDRRLDCSLHRK